MKKKLIIISITLILLITILFIFKYIFYEMRLGFQEGPDLSYIHLSIANEYMQQIDKAIDDYYDKYKKYPIINGKNFYYTLKDFLNINDVYLFYDSVNVFCNISGLKYKRNRNEISDSLFFSIINSRKIFIGVGRPEYYINIRKISDSTFKIYYVGKNGLDENGLGDDVVYKKEK